MIFIENLLAYCNYNYNNDTDRAKLGEKLFYLEKIKKFY